MHAAVQVYSDAGSWQIQSAMISPCFVCYLSIGLPVSIRFRVVEDCFYRGKPKHSFS